MCRHARRLWKGRQKSCASHAPHRISLVCRRAGEHLCVMMVMRVMGSGRVATSDAGGLLEVTHSRLCPICVPPHIARVPETLLTILPRNCPRHPGHGPCGTAIAVYMYCTCCSPFLSKRVVTDALRCPLHHQSQTLPSREYAYCITATVLEICWALPIEPANGML